MNREQKTAAVDELAERLERSQAIFAVDYRGITVPQAAELRGKLRESDASFKVVKNRLAKRAAEQAGTTELDELFTGPVALAFIDGDPVVVAKTITTFRREHEVLEYKGGIMDGAALDVESFQAIARLPGLDVLHGQLVGLAASPLTGLVAGMSNLISGLGRQLAQIAEQGLVRRSEAEPSPAVVEAADSAGEAPEPEAPVEEPTPADEPAPEETPVEESPSEEEPEPEAEGEPEAPADEPETEDETETPEEADAEGEPSEGAKED